MWVENHRAVREREGEGGGFLKATCGVVRIYKPQQHKPINVRLMPDSHLEREWWSVLASFVAPRDQ